MIYKEYKPSPALEAYVKCFYTIETEAGSMMDDKAFATGCMEIMFTLSGSPWKVKIGEVFKETSAIELWGQILRPLTFRAEGKGMLVGIRFFPPTASFLLREDINQFNDGVFSLPSVLGQSVMELHEQLCEAQSVKERIRIVETFLYARLMADSKTLNKIALVSRVVKELTDKDFFDNIENVAERYGITSRYLHKIFVQQTGLSPKLVAKINRFQNSLVLLAKGKLSLTAIANECGYFDQSHFIREFKSFTGYTPSGFNGEESTAVLASPNR